MSPADDVPVPPRLFRRSVTLAELNALSHDTAMVPLGIVFTELGPDYLRATMPVDARTRQPYGLLHGGASVLLAETLGSTAGNLCAEEGAVCAGTARPLHIGRSTQVWEIRIEDDGGRLACISRLTLAVVPRLRR
jgi:1,4-dihydroxy-2-naphthoyl-CoA hydrolase